MTNNQSNIVVSICCLTYNHAPFIRKALDGFLMQQPPSCVPQGAKMSDWCEILIHDDCSTDGTDEIIREYAANYPDLIFPLYEEENQYSRGGKGHMDFYNYNRAKGKYIAYCEGDDYWTAPNKLQKQVDFMESHPDYSVCWHRVVVVDVEDQVIHNGKADKLFEGNADVCGIDIDIPKFFENWYTQPCSMVIRRSSLDLSWHTKYKSYCDTYEIYHLLKIGKGRIMNIIAAHYRIHQGGVASSMSEIQGCLSELGYIEELYHRNRDVHTKNYWQSVLLWTMDVLNRNGEQKKAWAVFLREFKIFPMQTTKIIYILTKRMTKAYVKKCSK